MSSILPDHQNAIWSQTHQVEADQWGSFFCSFPQAIVDLAAFYLYYGILRNHMLNLYAIVTL